MPAILFPPPDTLDVTSPLRLLLIHYRRCPGHEISFSASRPTLAPRQLHIFTKCTKEPTRATGPPSHALRYRGVDLTIPDSVDCRSLAFIKDNRR